jgi:biotin transport system substrate-specific component
LPDLPVHLLTRVALFAALTAIGALVSIPVGSVPFTMQVVFVLLAGFVLGPWLGALSMLVYVVLGLIMPVYAGGASGVGTLLGPTGGYLWGFVVAAWLTGWQSRRLRSPRLVSLVLAGAIGLLPIYALGAVWLAISLHLSARAALAAGVTPFIVFDCLKAGLAGLTARALASLPPDLRALTRSR